MSAGNPTGQGMEEYNEAQVAYETREQERLAQAQAAAQQFQLVPYVPPAGAVREMVGVNRDRFLNVEVLDRMLAQNPQALADFLDRSSRRPHARTDYDPDPKKRRKTMDQQGEIFIANYILEHPMMSREQFIAMYPVTHPGVPMDHMDLKYDVALHMYKNSIQAAWEARWNDQTGMPTGRLDGAGVYVDADFGRQRRWRR